jgi:hypothetical protein
MTKTPLDLIPNEVHHIKLENGAMILMSENKKVNHEVMNLIDISNLRVEHLPVYTMHDVIHGEEILGIARNTPTQNVEGSKVLLLHRARLIVHSKQTSLHGVLNYGIAQALSKLSPSGSHQLVPSHPNHFPFIGLVEVNGGIELSDDVFVNDMVKLYQGQKTQLITNSFDLAKVLRRLVHVLDINRVHGSQTDLLLSIDLKKYPLLHGGVEIGGSSPPLILSLLIRILFSSW